MSSTATTTNKTITVAGRTYEQRKMSELVAGDVVLVGYDMGVNLYTGKSCLLYTSPSPRDVEESRMPSSA